MDTLSTPESAAPPPAAIALFGLDDLGKPHASRFTAAEADRVAKAAELMGLHVLALTGSDGGDLVARLPAGRIFEASGKAFVPFVARPLFERLATLGGISVPPAAPKPEKAPKPETAPKPAKVPKSDAKAAEPKPGAKAAVLAASNLMPARDVEPSGVPIDWPHIRQGSLVLATSGGVADGWFESVVVEEKPDDLMVLRWRDFPGETLFLRRRDQLALLPAATPLTPKP